MSGLVAQKNVRLWTGTNYSGETENAFTTYFYKPEIRQVATPSGVASITAKTVYRYDSRGRLGTVTDATGRTTRFLYDNVGLKVADISPDGSLTEYRYDKYDNLIQTARYADRLTTTQINQLVDTAGNPGAVEIASVRPSTTNADNQWEWRVYDGAQRLQYVVDGTGAFTSYVYDSAGRVVTVTQHGNLLNVTSFKTTPPASISPGTNAANRATRYFYDKDGRSIGTLDAEGYLTETRYDGAGQKVHTIAYAGVADTAIRATDDFATLLADVQNNVDPTTVDHDIHAWFLYDARGLLRASIDGEGDLTRYAYTALGHLVQQVTGQKLDPAALLTAPPTLATLPTAPSASYLESWNWTRDNYGQIKTEAHTLYRGTGATTVTETTEYVYDAMRRLTSVTRAQGTSDARTATQRYDLRGRLIGELSGEANAALGATPTPAQVDAAYALQGVNYIYDAADRLIAKVEPNGIDGTGLKTRYYYDGDGRLTHMINAAGEITAYEYDAFDQRTATTLYGTRIAATPLATLTGGLLDATSAAVIAVAVNNSILNDTQRWSEEFGQCVKWTACLKRAMRIAVQETR